MPPLVLFGALGCQRPVVREPPDVDPPIFSVSVTARGAGQRSRLPPEFNLDRPIEVAAREVRDLVARVRSAGEQVVVSGGERLQNGAEVVTTVVEHRQVSGRESAP